MLWKLLPSKVVLRMLTNCSYRLRRHMFHMLGIRMGETSCVHSPFRIANSKPKQLKDSLSLGSRVYIGMDCLFDLKDRIAIGDRVTVAYRVNLLTHWNPGYASVGALKPPSHAPIRIENDVYIGTNATVLPGVTLGEGCIVAAGAVVTHDVPPHVQVGGVPASVMRTLKPSE
jgi:acetyltransferase-like isoleucine patch superfamily enzyme